MLIIYVKLVKVGEQNKRSVIKIAKDKFTTDDMLEELYGNICEVLNEELPSSFKVPVRRKIRIEIDMYKNQEFDN